MSEESKRLLQLYDNLIRALYKRNNPPAHLHNMTLMGTVNEEHCRICSQVEDEYRFAKRAYLNAMDEFLTPTQKENTDGSQNDSLT